jgi:hypothetical protein
MGCGCGKKKRTFTQEDPLILGDDEGDARQVRATVHVLGVASGQTAWVRGTRVGFYVDRGYLLPV